MIDIIKNENDYVAKREVRGRMEQNMMCIIRMGRSYIGMISS